MLSDGILGIHSQIRWLAKGDAAGQNKFIYHIFGIGP
jgi:hypothetical protein